MDWIFIAQVVNLLIFLISLYFYIQRKPFFLLPTLFIAMGLHGFNFLLGTLWFPFKVVNLIIFLYLLTRIKPKNPEKSVYISFSVIFFLGFVNALFNLPDKGFNTGLLQGPLLRPIIQLYTYFSTFSLIVFIPFVTRNYNTLLRLDKYYMKISEFIIIIGFIHFLFLKADIPFMPIIRSSGENNEIAKFSAKGIIMTRIYGFTGEPKTLGSFLLPYFFVSFYKYLNGFINKNKRYHAFMLILSLFVIIQTYSSAVLIGLGLALLLGFILKLLSLKNKIIIRSFYVLVALFLIGNQLIEREGNYEKISFLQFLEARTIGRVQEEIDERGEITVLNNIMSKAALPIMGFGPGMYVFSSEEMVYSKGINKIDSGWVTIFSDLGITGILLFLAVIIMVTVNRKHILKKYYVLYNSYLFGLISVATTMLGNYEPILFPLFLGFIFAVYKLNNAEK